MAKKYGLGRGLQALMRDGTEEPPTPQPPAAPTEQPEAEEPPRTVLIEQIQRNSLQPRHVFNEQALAELTESIRQHGVLQPLLVRAVDSGYELIAGERRLRAAKQAGLKKVPVTVTTAEDVDSLELALIENLQREDLNILEEAEGYQALIDKFDLTQEQIAERVGKGRATVANALRILTLPKAVQSLISDGELMAGHAKVIMGIEAPDLQVQVARRVVDEGMSVRALEKEVQKLAQPPRRRRVARQDIPNNHLQYLSDRLHSYFGTSVRMNPCRTYANGKKSKGSLEIDFYSNDDLNRILELIGVSLD